MSETPSGLAAIVSLAFRYRRASTTERAQLKWLVYAGALIVTVLTTLEPAHLSVWIQDQRRAPVP
jgi:hypothetical protein